MLRLYETTRYVWPPAFDEDADRRAAFGHLVEGLLQQEQPEVYNAFKVRKYWAKYRLIDACMSIWVAGWSVIKSYFQMHLFKSDRRKSIFFLTLLWFYL